MWQNMSRIVFNPSFDLTFLKSNSSLSCVLSKVQLLVNLSGLVERLWLYCAALTHLLWSRNHSKVQVWKEDSFFGSCGEPCGVAEGVREGSGGVVPERADGSAVRSSQTLPAEHLEQAYCSKYQPPRLLPTRSWDLLLSIRWWNRLWSELNATSDCALIWVLGKGCFPLLCLAQLVCWLLLWPVAQSPSNVWNGASAFQTHSALLKWLLIHRTLSYS